MKIPAFVTTFFAIALSATAATSLEDFSPHFATNMPIVWQATNQLPKSLWIYRRLPPRPFSASVISNAAELASLQKKVPLKPSTNDFFLAEDHPPDCPWPIPVIFSITSASATINYGLPHPGTNTADIPPDKIVVQRARACATQLGLDPAQIAFKEMTSHFNRDTNDNDITNQLCGRGVFLSRKLDDILFFGNGQNPTGEGFWMEFGTRGQIRAFSLIWPELKRAKLETTANPTQIIACIRAFKTMAPPENNEQNYFNRLKNLASASKLTITNAIPYYCEGTYGITPTNSEPSEVITPIVQLGAIANFRSSNASVRLLSPLLLPDVNRLLARKVK